MSNASNDKRINYVEFPVRDLAATKQFYGSAFGWSFQDWGEDYVSFHEAGIDGGFRQENEVPLGGPLVVLYATDLEGIQDRIEQSGGSIVKEIFSFPGGRRFHFTDPTGHELAVWSDA